MKIVLTAKPAAQITKAVGCLVSTILADLTKIKKIFTFQEGKEFGFDELRLYMMKIHKKGEIHFVCACKA